MLCSPRRFCRTSAQPDSTALSGTTPVRPSFPSSTKWTCLAARGKRSSKRRNDPPSKLQPHSELNLSRPRRRRDAAECGRRHIHYRGRLVVVRPVEEVERFPAELNVEPLVLAESRVLPRAHVG